MPAPKRTLRRSQAVSTFGPGAIVDLRQESVMMAGTDYWPENRSIVIHEPNLERALRLAEFRMPATTDAFAQGESRDLPIVRFPQYLVCPRCHRLGDIRLFTAFVGGERVIKCTTCQVPVYPARLVVACKLGHIDDFPWDWWAHRGRETCEHPALFLTSTGTTASLADMVLSCKTCGASNNLSGATQTKNLHGLKCRGHRPWLLDKEACEEPLVPLQRGASNVYFSVTTSSISIPPWSAAVHAALNQQWNTLKHVPADALQATIEGMQLPSKLGMPVDEIVRAILERKGELAEGTKELTERQLRYGEAAALRQVTPSHQQLDDFSTLPGEIDPMLDGLISKVIRVERLREVRALLGFSRVESPDPSSRFDSQLAPLSATPLNWRPAVEVRGEGIYLELDEDALRSWQGRPEIADRVAMLSNRYADMCARRKWKVDRNISPRLVLVHTFAHALIRQLALDSGYSSAALRERLYVFEADEVAQGSLPLAGVLIYTSTADSEGSLGGLVRQAMPQRLATTIVSAIQEATWCSSDPLCSESEGQGNDGLNLAACHACMLLSETCCEEFNRILDRATLAGLPHLPEIGFFSDLVGH